MSNRSIAPMAASVAAALWFSTAQAGHASKAPQVSAPPASTQPSAAFLERADQILAVYNGQARMRPILSEKAAAEAKVSPDAAAASAERMFTRARKRFGPALGVSHVVATSPYKGDVFVNFEKAQVRLWLGVEPEAPHKVRGFSVGSPLSNPKARAR